MAEAKIICSKNYSEYEEMLLKQMLSNHPVIESKNHITATEQKKRSGWAAICSEFNANENVTTRGAQLQVRYLHLSVFHISHIHVTSLILNEICPYRLCGRTLNWL